MAQLVRPALLEPEKGLGRTSLQAMRPMTCSVTPVTFRAIPSWLTATVATNTTRPKISFSLTARKTAHLVIGCAAPRRHLLLIL